MAPRGVATTKGLSAEVLGGELTADEQKFMETGGESPLAGDTNDAGAGSDTLPGGGGQDTVSAGGNADTAGGGQGADPVSGGAGNDELPAHLRGKFVPHGAMHEERVKRQAAEERERTTADQNRILAERTGKLLETFNQAIVPVPAPTPAPIPVPDMDKDPLGYIAYTLHSQQHEIEALKAGQGKTAEVVQQTQEQAEGQRKLSGLINTAANLEREFQAKTPDYPDATNYLAAQRHKQLEYLGIADPQARHQQILQESWVMAAQAIQNGRNPAEIMYEMAKLSGYRPAEKPAETVPGAAGGVATGAAKLELVKKGQEDNVSLSGARGSGPEPLTVQTLLAMDDAEFDKAIQTKAGRALMGA